MVPGSPRNAMSGTSAATMNTKRMSHKARKASAALSVICARTSGFSFTRRIAALSR